MDSQASAHSGHPVMALDVTRAFRIPTASFDFVYAEHLIEHIILQGARIMLAECHRILKPGVVIPIAKPSLGFLSRVISPDRGVLEEHHRTW